MNYQNYYNGVRKNSSIYPSTIQSNRKETEKREQIDSITNRYSLKESNPLMFTPPKVQDQQILHKKKEKRSTSYEKSEENMLKKNKNESIPSELDQHFSLQLTEHKGNLIKDGILEEENKDDSQMKTTFEHSFSLMDNFSLNEDLVAEFSAMLEISNKPHDEESSNEYESSSSNDGTLIFKDEYPLYEDLVDKFSAMLEDSSAFQDEVLYTNDETSSFFDGPFSSMDDYSKHEDLVEKISTMLGDPNNLQTNLSSDESSYFYDDCSSVEDESSCSYDDFCSVEDESSCCIDDSSSVKDESSSLVDESLYTQAESSYKDEGLLNCNKPKIPIVKLPVLLGQLNIDINIHDSFDLVLPVSSITKIDWSLHSLDCDVLLPTSNVFLKGVIIADIEYVKDNDSNSIHSQKIMIPWQKVSKINWLHFPKLPSNHQSEYMFQLYDPEDTQYHREFNQQFAEKIQSDLQHINFIWHNELVSNHGNSEVDFQGKVNLSIFLLQSQYVDLNAF